MLALSENPRTVAARHPRAGQPRRLISIPNASRRPTMGMPFSNSSALAMRLSGLTAHCCLELRGGLAPARRAGTLWRVHG